MIQRNESNFEFIFDERGKEFLERQQKQSSPDLLVGHCPACRLLCLRAEWNPDDALLKGGSFVWGGRHLPNPVYTGVYGQFFPGPTCTESPHVKKQSCAPSRFVGCSWVNTERHRMYNQMLN